MAKGKKFGLGLILGAIVGAVTGILTAPKSGKETRQDIKDKAGEIKDSAEKKLKIAHKDLDNLADKAKKMATELQGKAKAEMEEYGKKAEDLRERTKRAITSVKSGDGEEDDASIDQLLNDLSALKDKIVSKAKNIRK